MKQKLSKRGFTLIELLIVIAIIGILLSVGLASMNSARLKARDTKRLQELRQVQKGIEMYYNQYGEYPLCGGDDVCSSTGYRGDMATLLSIYGITIPNDPVNQNGSYGYYYARGYKKTGPTTFSNTGSVQDYIIATRIETAPAVTWNLATWNNASINWIEGN